MRLVASERPIGAPSRTRAVASMTASRIGRLMTTSPEIRSASSTGTALAVRMLRVRVKRAVLKPRSSFPASGKLESMLERAALSQERELEGLVTALTGLLGPLLIVVMGLFVMGIVFAMLLPIFEMNTLIR